MAELTDHEKAIQAMLRQRFEKDKAADATLAAAEAAELELDDERISNSLDHIKQQKDKEFERFRERLQEEEHISQVLFEQAEAVFQQAQDTFQQAKAVHDAEITKSTKEYTRKAKEITERFKLRLDQAFEDRNLFSKKKIKVEEGWKKRKQATELRARKELMLALDELYQKDEEVIPPSQNNIFMTQNSTPQESKETLEEYVVQENHSLNDALPPKNLDDMTSAEIALKFPQKPVDNESSASLPLKIESMADSKIKLIHDGRVYISPPCMKGVPVEKISEPVEGGLFVEACGSKKYWESQWTTTKTFLNEFNLSIQGLRAEIEEGCSGFIQANGEAERESDSNLDSLRGKLRSKENQLAACQKIVDYFASQDIHPNQLLGKEYIQGGGLIRQQPLRSLQSILNTLISAKEKRIIDVEPALWLRIRLAELIEEKGNERSLALKRTLNCFMASDVKFRKVVQKAGKRTTISNNDLSHKDEERGVNLKFETENSSFNGIEMKSEDQSTHSTISKKRGSMSTQLPASKRNVKSHRTSPASLQGTSKTSNVTAKAFSTPSNSVKNNGFKKPDVLNVIGLASKAPPASRKRETDSTVSMAPSAITAALPKTDATPSTTTTNEWTEKDKMSVKHNIHSNVFEVFQDNNYVGKLPGSRGLDTNPTQVSTLTYKTTKKYGDTVVLHKSSGNTDLSGRGVIMQLTFESTQIAVEFALLLHKFNPKINAKD